MTNQTQKQPDQLFCTAEDWWNDACINFTHDGLYLYAYGYKQAADILANSVLESGLRNDTLIHPMVFCYRHYLELSFKYIHSKSLQFLGRTSNTKYKHHIDKIWNDCIPLLNEIFSDKDSESLREIKRLVDEFSKIDPHATAFRYPEDIKGEISLKGITHISISNLAQVMENIDAVVHGVMHELSEYYNIRMELEPYE